MNPESLFWRRSFSAACGVFAIAAGVANADVTLTSSALTYTGGSFVVTEANGDVVNTAGITLSLSTGGSAVPVTVSATKSGAVTTVKATATLSAGKSYSYLLTVPKAAGTPQAFSGTLNSFVLPVALDGMAGTVGTWGVREYNFTGASTIQQSLNAIALSPPFVEASRPVLNAFDPDTNDINSSGDFNNDFPILTNTSGDDSFVVVGKTKVTVAAAGDYTFAIHSDDGFAMRVVGPSGGRFTSVAGSGKIDQGDNQTIYADGGFSDTNTHGVYHFDAAGTYDILYLGYDGGGGTFYEVAWSPGVFTEDRQTNTWTLVGNPNDPSIPPFRDRFLKTIPGVAGTAGNWGIRTYLNAGNISTPADASNFLATTTRLPSDADGMTIDSQRPYLNETDPDDAGNAGVASGDEPFPGDIEGNDDDHVVTVAKTRINVATTGTYTFRVECDDGFFMRITGVGATATPSFKQVTDNGNRDMSHPNEWYANSNGNTRAVIDLPAGSYDIDFVQLENTGGFAYEVVSAAGSWPTGTPTGGWALLGYNPPAGTTVIVPKIMSPGWTVETSTPGLSTIDSQISNAEIVINVTESSTPAPAGAITTWTKLDFEDPEQPSNEGDYKPRAPFPLNTSGQDNNFAMRATGKMQITVAGEYCLGFQGDDGGYLMIDGPGNPSFKTIVETREPNQASLVEENPGSGITNEIIVEKETPNSHTIASIDLQVGVYTIKTLYFQGAGNSFWEVVGAKTPPSKSFVFPLLASDGPATVPVNGSFPLIVQTVVPVATPFNITGFTTSGSPTNAAQFTFASANAGTYSVQVSTDLVTWTTVTATITDNGNGTSKVNASFAGQMVNGQAIVGQPKLFVRVVRTF